jgi:hypothetical protein
MTCKHSAAPLADGNYVDKAARILGLTKPGFLARMRDFFEDPASMKAYLEQHCESKQLVVTSEAMTGFYPPPYYNVPERGSMTLCINSTYLETVYQCAPLPNATHRNCVHVSFGT